MRVAAPATIPPRGEGGYQKGTVPSAESTPSGGGCGSPHGSGNGEAGVPACAAAARKSARTTTARFTRAVVATKEVSDTGRCQTSVSVVERAVDLRDLFGLAGLMGRRGIRARLAAE